MVNPTKKENEKCYKCNRIEWITYTTPRKIHEFIYSGRNLLAATIISFIAYFASVGQPEIIRRTLAAFVFTAGCWILEVFPLPITGLMIPLLLTLLGVFEPTDAEFSNKELKSLRKNLETQHTQQFFLITLILLNCFTLVKRQRKY